MRLRSAVLLSVCLSAVTALGALDRKYPVTLLELCDALVATQRIDPASPDCGALVCPSTNPQEHPLHSRAAEAVYPLAIAYRETGAAKYRDAAIRLADWLITKQQASGAWGEEWPNYDGWNGTTSDQLISLAGAWPILQEHLTAAQRQSWDHAMRFAAAHIVRTFPAGNVNYQPTGAVALLLAARAVADPPAEWPAKADALMAIVLNSVNPDGLIVGEGQGVDLGYNLAQSIGYIALYGILKSDAGLRRRAADLLRAHAAFVYPNGSVDNSWGTRSFKWTYESGTKTAPGVYFTFALLADEDPTFAPAGKLCLDYLTAHTMRDGLVLYGAHASGHDSTNPPCLYSTFARAQSLALAIAYAPAECAPATPAQTTDWFRYYPSVKVVVVRTEKIMATVSAYGGIARYGREAVSRGGSLTNLWMEGYGLDGQAQASSVTTYQREEKAHMPDEGALLPLTPRIECTIEGIYYTNLFEADGEMNVSRQTDHIAVTTTGHMRSATGADSGVTYRITHRFYADHLAKEYSVTSPHAQAVRIVEPVVNDRGTRIRQVSAERVTIQPPGHAIWALDLSAGPAGGNLSLGADAGKYWCPFPAIDCYPVSLEFNAPAGQPTTVGLTLGPG